MKKILIAAFILFCFTAISKAQAYTFTSDGDTIKLTTIYGVIYGDTLNSMSDYSIQYYSVAVKVNGSDSMLVAYNAALTYSFYTESSPPWNWLGKFKSVSQPDIWFKPASGTSVTIKFDEIIK